MYRFWKLALILSVVTGWAASQNSPAHVPQPVVSTRLNNPTALNCDSHGQPLSVCLWERNVEGQRSVISINSGMDQNGRATLTPGITYAGEGLNSGKCGINIESIKENDSGRWSCTLIGANGGIFIGTVDVTILRKPGAPEFDASLGVLNEGDTKDINCYSANGQPPPTFQWFIGDTPVDSSELKPIGNNTNNNVAYTFQTLRHTFTWQDSGKQLRCVIVSEALAKEDKVEVSQDISVYYAPKSSEEHVTVRVPELGTEASLAINISANPAPRIQWQTSKLTLVAGNKSPDQRLEARMPKQVGPDLYLCELIINKVEEEDLNLVYKLIAQNQQGSANFELRLSSAAEASTGLSAGGIVGLVLGIPLILIVVALIVVYTRAKGLLCFKDGGDSHSTAHIEGATSENGDRGNENPVGDHEGYPPSSQTPPLAKTNGNGNHAPPPAPTVPPPNDEENTMYNYNIINGRSVKDRDDGTSSEKERMGGDGDSNKGGNEEKPTISSRITAAVENLLARKKDKTAPVDEEAAKQQEKEKDAQAGNNEEKKPEDIVYAELDIARGGTEGGPQPVIVRGSDEKTEYAEIVGVVPPAQVQDEPEKKSSGGSKNPSPKK